MISSSRVRQTASGDCSNPSDFQVVNHLGTVFHTFSTRKAAVDWVKANVTKFPGLRVEQVTTTVHRLTVYRPRPALVTP